MASTRDKSTVERDSDDHRDRVTLKGKKTPQGERDEPGPCEAARELKKKKKTG